MNNIEKKLFKDLNENIEVPDKVRTVIEESINKAEKKKHSYIKNILTVCACLVLIIGLAYVGTKTYNGIKKDTEKVADVYSNEEIEEKNIVEIENKEQEKASEKPNPSNIITEEEAEEKAKKILKEYGLENETIKNIKFKNDIENDKIWWIIETENNISIALDARNGEYFEISE